MLSSLRISVHYKDCTVFCLFCQFNLIWLDSSLKSFHDHLMIFSNRVPCSGEDSQEKKTDFQTDNIWRMQKRQNQYLCAANHQLKYQLKFMCALLVTCTDLQKVVNAKGKDNGVSDALISPSFLAAPQREAAPSLPPPHTAALRREGLGGALGCLSSLCLGEN